MELRCGFDFKIGIASIRGALKSATFFKAEHLEQMQTTSLEPISLGDDCLDFQTIGWKHLLHTYNTPIMSGWTVMVDALQTKCKENHLSQHHLDLEDLKWVLNNAPKLDIS